MAYAEPMLAGLTTKAQGAMSDMTGLILVIAGEGAGASIAEIVKSWFPDQTANLSDETLIAIVGFALFYFGDRIHKRLTSFGLGLFLSGVGAFTSSFIGGFLGMLKKA